VKVTKPIHPSSFSAFILHPSSFILFFISLLSAEPIVMNGAMLPEFIGTPLSHLRIVNNKGAAIPFQIDERTVGGEYICNQGERPNADSGNGIFDKQDEIVFLWEDVDSAGAIRVVSPDERPVKRVSIAVRCGEQTRSITIIDDKKVPFSPVSYLTYDHARQYLQTPYFYAQFGVNRFHFTRAGCMDFRTGKFLDLTGELRVEIALRALWGLIPLHYTEENMVCHVTRFKAGPIRLIRRGDFYLKLGLGLKACRAVVYQMCYPQMVKVPVNVWLPIRFSHIFSSAFIEMTPVIRKGTHSFRFEIPSIGYTQEISGDCSKDTLINTIPDRGYIVTDGEKGYAWTMQMKVLDPKLLFGSGYIFRRPSHRTGMAECGLRLTVRDLPKGDYEIVNWVLFSKHPFEASNRDSKSVLEPAAITTPAGLFSNLLVDPITHPR
jgi:hypothetical protein